MIVVFGTANSGKLTDVKNLINDSSIDIRSLYDIGVQPPDVVENGETFEENALIKYDTLRPLVPDKYVLVTEDSGLGIDVLNGEPGVHSRRWNRDGREMTDDEIIKKTLKLMKGKKDRIARFVSVVAFGGNAIPRQTMRGELIGTLLEQPDPKGMINGLPYRSLFYVPQLRKMLYEIHEIPLDQRLNFPTHREQAWLKLIKKVKQREYLTLR